MKKLFSVFLLIVMCTINIFPVYAETTDSCMVTYRLNGQDVIEETTWSNQQELCIQRIVHPDGTGEIVVNNGENRQIVSFAGADYSLYCSWVESNPFLDDTDLGFHNVNVKGSDLTGSQYKHSAVISNQTKVYYKSELAGWKTFADTYAALAVSFVDIPSIVLSGLVELTVHAVENNTPEKLTVRTSMYEVYFSYDNVYYCHCYHMQCNSVNPTSTYTDYKQVVGG